LATTATIPVGNGRRRPLENWKELKGRAEVKGDKLLLDLHSKQNDDAKAVLLGIDKLKDIHHDVLFVG
jgi:hypothetical protein